MQTKPLVLTIATALLLACSSSGTPSGFGGSGESGSSGGASSSSGATASSGSSGGDVGGSSNGGNGSSGSSGGSSSGAAPHDGGTGPGIFADADITDADVGQTVTLTADAFTVAAGAEVFMCQVFSNPFGGAEADLISMHGTMSVGSHHFFLFNMDPNATALSLVYAANIGKLAPCPGGGLEFHPFPFLSQQPDWTVNYPTAADGSPMGYPLVAANSLMINIHYLNATSEAISPTVSITIKTAKPGVVKTHVGTVFLNQTALSVPYPVLMTSPVPTTKTWNGDTVDLPANYSIYASISHMHQWSVGFTASTNNNVFYTESDWSSPPLTLHNPVIPMTNSQSITWSCSYFNNTGATLTFGDSAKTNIMCIYMGDYYPASATNPDIIAALN